MALDGAFLHCLRDELWERLQESRIDKIHQPSKEELVLSMRGKSGTEKVYLSARVNSPRIHLTASLPENPASPPMFCMFLRKHLTGARLAAIRQIGLERVLYLDFDAVNELGDAVRLTLAAEIMGRYSNIILIGEDGKIMDAIKRVDLTMSPIRPILPGADYLLPPSDTVHWDISQHTPEELAAHVGSLGGASLDKALLAGTQGMSPLLCREAAYQALRGETYTSALTEAQTHRLERVFHRVQAAVASAEKRVPYLLYRTDRTPLDFSFIPITQYGLSAVGKESKSFSQLLDEFYAEKDAAQRLHQHSHDIFRVLNTSVDRISRRLENQRRELEASSQREEKRLYADVINANLGAIPKGASSAELINYYDENAATLRVPLDPALSAVQNAQKYYKEYRKAKTAEDILKQQLLLGETELQYLDSVFDMLSRATTTRELEELRQELEQTGYLRRRHTRQKPPPTKPLEFVSDDGFTILVGRNNLQNDRLTTKIAKGSDWWFHTKNIAGSHTVVLTEGVIPPERTLEQAAILAATHSKAAASSQVPVDYTQIRHVKKPAGSKPGMVIYETNRTVFVTPDPLLANRLRIVQKT